MTAPGNSVLTTAGPQADRIAALWDVFFAVCVVVATLVIAATAVATWRAHRRADDSEPAGQERRIHAVIAAATGATAITLVILLVSSLRTGHALASLDHTDPVEITVTGHQWWWQLDYEDVDDPSRRFTTANELHVPVGRSVHLRLRSADVIHSFWTPSLHGKKDLIPGRDNHTWFRVDRAGTFRGQCAEFCGPEHAKMELRVIADAPADYAAWADRQREPARSPTTARRMRGRELFATGPCAMCHAIAGTPAGAGLGPDLTHLASRDTLGAGAMPNTHDDLAAWISDPQDHKPGVRMPAQPMPADDLAALLDYLESLR